MGLTDLHHDIRFVQDVGLTNIQYYIFDFSPTATKCYIGIVPQKNVQNDKNSSICGIVVVSDQPINFQYRYHSLFYEYANEYIVDGQKYYFYSARTGTGGNNGYKSHTVTPDNVYPEIYLYDDEHYPEGFISKLNSQNMWNVIGGGTTVQIPVNWKNLSASFEITVS